MDANHQKHNASKEEEDIPPETNDVFPDDLSCTRGDHLHLNATE
jgi:hypothetical protein